jgi:hypothetical protein
MRSLLLVRAARPIDGMNLASIISRATRYAKPFRLISSRRALAQGFRSFARISGSEFTRSLSFRAQPLGGTPTRWAGFIEYEHF